MANLRLPSTSLLNRLLVWLAARICAVGYWLAAASLLLIVALNALNVVLRYFFFFTLPWAEEAMLFLMIFAVYIGGISVAWQQAHIRIDMLVNYVAPSWRATVETVGRIVTVAILLPIMLASYGVVIHLIEFEEHSDALQVPMWIPQTVIPLSLLLIAVMFLLRVFVTERAEGGISSGKPGAA